MAETIPQATITYLMEGDPVIRWQTMRDLLDAPVSEWEAERARVAEEGWGAQFLGRQHPDGGWPEDRWTGTVWTLLTLVDLGMPVKSDRFEASFERVVGRLMPTGKLVSGEVLRKRMDLCHLGFWLRLGSYFAPDDERLAPLAETVLGMQMADGGWNCRVRAVPKTTHSSFHTTFNVLEGLRPAAALGHVAKDVFQQAEARAIEFMLEHKMYRSDKTGAVIDERFLHLTFPSHWHYTILRGLDYIRETPSIKDPRLADPLAVIRGRQKANGRWIVEKRIPGVTFFDMEKMGTDSRWNTLRALRVLRAAAV